MPRRNEKSFRVMNATAVRPAVPSSVTPAALSMTPGAVALARNSNGTKIIASASTKPASARYCSGFDWTLWATWLAIQPTTMKAPSTSSQPPGACIRPIAIGSARPELKK